MDITTKQETTVANINGQFIGYVDNEGTIYQFNTMTGARLPVGVTHSVYNELQGICDGYYDKLVELGVIKPQKTQEQIIEEQQAALAKQQEAMDEMLSIMKDLKKEVEVLRNGRSENRPSSGNKS
ncbi:MAG: hypothetical protein IJ516_05695 [Phascolarctobacterium sp.]|nr:hypothetical protein [Phascolarctobacterium sp.]